jgi:hypothetical protein
MGDSGVPWEVTKILGFGAAGFFAGFATKDMLDQRIIGDLKKDLEHERTGASQLQLQMKEVLKRLELVEQRLPK